MIENYIAFLPFDGHLTGFCPPDSLSGFAGTDYLSYAILALVSSMLIVRFNMFSGRPRMVASVVGASSSAGASMSVDTFDATSEMGSCPKKPVILVAEDNMSNYKLLEVILRNEYRLIHALNGQVAVDLFDSVNPDLVLMDINMPVMDGYEAMRLIKLKAPKSIIIALTAYAFESDKQKMLSSGFDDFFPKPIKIIEFKEMIAGYLKSIR